MSTEATKQNFQANDICVPLSTPNQVQIQFPHPPKSVLIVKLWKNIQTAKALIEVANWLKKEYGMKIIVEATVKEEEGTEEFDLISEKSPSEGIDFCVVIGGDGTLLHLNSIFQEPKSIPPVVPLAMGSLGFLLPYPFSSYQSFIKMIVDPHPSSVILRTRLYCRIFNSQHHEIFSYQCLNELLVSRTSESPNLNKLEFYVDNQMTTLIQADGVIISSPTGSTAYSLSAGGTMMPPQVPGIAVTPICPHTLSFRPLVLPDCSRLKIRVPLDTRVKVMASFDGRKPTHLGPGFYAEVTVSPWPMPTFTISSPIVEWFRSIESRLHWNVREIQKPLPVDHLETASKENTQTKQEGKKEQTAGEIQRPLSADLETTSKGEEQTKPEQERKKERTEEKI